MQNYSNNNRRNEIKNNKRRPLKKQSSSQSHRKPQSQNTSMRPKHYPSGAVPPIVRPEISEEEREEAMKNKTIPESFTNIYNKETDSWISFDQAVEKIKEQEVLSENESIVYAGAGAFAIVETVREGKQKKQIVKKKIDFEYRSEGMFDHLRVKFTNPYEPNPTPLSELYTNEDIANFELKK